MKKIKSSHTKLIFGYCREAHQQFFLENNSYYDIHPLIIYICLAYYHINTNAKGQDYYDIAIGITSSKYVKSDKNDLITQCYQDYDTGILECCDPELQNCDYGAICKQNDIVTMTVDLENGQIKYKVNDTDCSLFIWKRKQSSNIKLKVFHSKLMTTSDSESQITSSLKLEESEDSKEWMIDAGFKNKRCHNGFNKMLRIIYCMNLCFIDF